MFENGHKMNHRDDTLNLLIKLLKIVKLALGGDVVKSTGFVIIQFDKIV